jgi:chemotaxis regulatin CheY-phosphate phosphatase CheZ
MIQVSNNLPKTSRVWVYQSNRIFTDSEVLELEEKLFNFKSNWEAHGTKLSSAIELYYKQFVVIFVDESFQEATGCSIDKSVSLMKSIERKFGVDVLDKMNLTYKDGKEVKNIKMAEFQGKAQSGEFTSEMTVFNNLVITKEEFLSSWETKAKNSWHNNLF